MVSDIRWCHRVKNLWLFDCTSRVSLQEITNNNQNPTQLKIKIEHKKPSRRCRVLRKNNSDSRNEKKKGKDWLSNRGANALTGGLQMVMTDPHDSKPRWSPERPPSDRVG
ncbi:unnamed protein product [Musa acuminata subsp. burmannicoides]